MSSYPISDRYRLKYAYGEDYGTRYFKYGPLKEGRPRIKSNVGFFPEESYLLKIFNIDKKVIVGEEALTFSTNLASPNLVYPMRDGEIRRDDERSWSIESELTRESMLEFVREVDKDFDGFYVTAALSAIAPDYMYERLLAMHSKLDEEFKAVKAFTIIPQPLAVAIAEKELSCIVVESGHGNTQIAPIHSYPIREAVVALYRGGAEADTIAAEVLKDIGYGDLANDELAVRRFKEAVGLIPRDLESGIKYAKENPEKLREKVRLSVLEVVDMEDKGWMRFLIGEVVFNPGHEIFESYKKRGVLSIRGARQGEEVIEGTLPLDEAIVRAASKTPLSVQDKLLSRIILSGGNFNWRVPPGLEEVATDSPSKVKLLLDERFRSELRVDVRLTGDPQFSVWKGCVVWSLALPDDYLWDDRRREGWFKRGVHY